MLLLGKEKKGTRGRPVRTTLQGSSLVTFRDWVVVRDPSAFLFPCIILIWPWKIIACTVSFSYNYETTHLNPADQIKHIIFP